MSSAVGPRPDFTRRKLVLANVLAGSTWWRLYEGHHPDLLGYGPGLSRFSDTNGKAFGLVYLGSSAKVAFVEAILRNSADGRGDDCVIDLAEIEKRSIATIEPIIDLRLIKLTGDGLLKLGAPSDVVGARDQTLAQQRSDAFHDHPDQPDDIQRRL